MSHLLITGAMALSIAPHVSVFDPLARAAFSGPIKTTQ